MSEVDTNSAAVEVLARIIGGRAPNNSEHDQTRAARTLEALLSERDTLRQQLAEARDSALEEVLDIVSDYPAKQHGDLPLSPHDAAEQAQNEIFNAIHALKSQENK